MWTRAQAAKQRFPPPIFHLQGHGYVSAVSRVGVQAARQDSVEKAGVTGRKGVPHHRGLLFRDVLRDVLWLVKGCRTPLPKQEPGLLVREAPLNETLNTKIPKPKTPDTLDDLDFHPRVEYGTKDLRWYGLCVKL